MQINIQFVYSFHRLHTNVILCWRKEKNSPSYSASRSISDFQKLFFEYVPVGPPYAQIPSGCLKPRIMPNPSIYNVFSIHTYL